MKRFSRDKIYCLMGCGVIFLGLVKVSWTAGVFAPGFFGFVLGVWVLAMYVTWDRL